MSEWPKLPLFEKCLPSTGKTHLGNWIDTVTLWTFFFLNMPETLLRRGWRGHLATLLTSRLFEKWDCYLRIRFRFFKNEKVTNTKVCIGLFQGYTPEHCARLIVNAIRDRKTDYIMAHADARFAVFLRYFWPTLLNYSLYIRGTKDQWAPKNKKE